MRPWAVIVIEFSAEEQIARADLFAIRRRRPAHSHTCRLPPGRSSRAASCRIPDGPIRLSHNRRRRRNKDLSRNSPAAPSSGMTVFMSAYPSPCACDGRFSGISSRKTAKSVPWSRLKPRRKYWLALPPPACCVMMTPGTVSKTSPERRMGRSSSSVWPTVPWVADWAIPVRSSSRPCTFTVVLTDAHSQRDAERGGRLGAYRDGNFFGFKIGVRYHESIITCRESGNREGAIHIRLGRSEYGTVRALNLHAGPGDRGARRINDSSRYNHVRGPGTPHCCE